MNALSHTNVYSQKQESIYEPSQVAGLIDSHTNPKREVIALSVPPRNVRGRLLPVSISAESSEKVSVLSYQELWSR